MLCLDLAQKTTPECFPPLENLSTKDPMRPRSEWLLRQPLPRRALMAALVSTSLIPTLRADYTAEVMSENPIVYYRFNDGVATDDLPSPAVNLGSAGAAANGSYTGSFVRGVPGALPGSSDTAVQGAGNLVEIPYTAAINNAGSFSVETWLKPTAIPAAAALISPIASFRENDGTYGRAGWLIYQGDANTGFNFRAYNRNGSTFTFSITSGPGTVTAGAWHHVVATWDSVANQGKLYVNGVLRATSAVITPSGPNNSTYEPNNTRPFTLGSRDGGFGWSGDLDEPAYYTSVLSDAQVLDHYNNGISPSPSQTYNSLVLAASPAGYWRVGEAAFTPALAVADNAGTLGNAGDGTYHAGSKNTTTGPAPTSGFQGFSENNSCLSLAGANGYVSAALGLLNDRPAFTVMGWVKRSAVHSTRGGYFGQNDLLEFGDATNGANIEAWVNARGGNMITPYSFADDQWGFIVLTGDTTKSTLYLNGVQVAQLSGSLSTYGSSAFNFNIGGGGIFGTTGDYFLGEIDEVAVFDKAVTQGRVKQLYDAALGGIGVEFVDTTPAVTPSSEIPEGQQFTLSVDTNGTPPFTYQWKKNGVDVPNSNSRTLTVTAEANPPNNDPYEYTVVVSNLGGGASATSDPAYIYVIPVLKWTGTDATNPGQWSIVGAPLNWKTFTAGVATAYSDNYATLFDDSGTALTATLTEPVSPVSLVVDSNTKNYTITGATSLSTGSGGIVKNGTSTLLLNVDDVFVNNVTVNAGTLTLGSGMVTGLYNNAAVAVNGGTLEIGLPTGTPYANATTVAAGAALAVTGSGDLKLESSSAIGGAGSEVFNRAGTVLVNMPNTVAGSVAIQSGTVVFDGSQNANRLAANQLVTVSPSAAMEIHGVNALPTAGNSVSVALNQATLSVVTGGSSATGPDGTSHAHLKNLTLDSSSVVLGYSGAGGAYSGESFQLNGGITVTGTAASTISLGSGTGANTSGVAISGNATHTIDVANATVGSDLVIDAELENTDASAADSAASILSKTGAGTLKLADGMAHGFSGTMQVNVGTLEATGSFAGPLTVASGAVVVPGNGVVGTLAAGGNSTLGGTYRCDIDGAVSDKLTVNGNLTLGAGAAIALNVGPGGVTAPSYQLASCTGTLSGPLPTLTGTIPPGYTLQVVSSSSLVLAQGSINTQPVVSSVVPSGNEDFNTSGGGFTVSAPVSPETDWAYNAGSWLSFGTDAGTGFGTNTTYLTTPIYTVSAAGAVTISFSHAYNFEADYDAGALEISVNGGAFTRLPGSAFTSNGYAANPLAAATNSALAGQEGFLGESAGYPAYHTTTATLLASAAVGNTVQVRFMGAYDDAYSAGGWEIDSFSITNALPSLMKLEWPLGIMQYSDTLQPPWTDLGGTSPLLIDTKAGPRRFFRIKP